MSSPEAKAILPPEKPTSGPKAILKLGLHVLALLCVSPWLLAYWVSKVFLGPNRALEGSSQALACLPGLPGVYLRRAFLSVVLARCARTAEVHFGTLFSQAGAILEENVYIGPRCQLGLVHCERDVLLAAGVHVPSGGKTHYFDDPTKPIREQGGERQKVTIGAGAWIGNNAIILAAVGRGTIVGAGSVVTKPLPDNVIAAGVPAKVIRPRFTDEKTTESIDNVDGSSRS
jgi:virginiamycin A acetyltransferase